MSITPLPEGVPGPPFGDIFKQYMPPQPPIAEIIEGLQRQLAEAHETIKQLRNPEGKFVSGSLAFPYQEIARLQRLLDDITPKHAEALKLVESLRQHNTKLAQQNHDLRDYIDNPNEDEEGEKCEGPSEPGMSEYGQAQLLVERQREVWHHRQIALELAVKSIPAGVGSEERLIPLAEQFYTFLTGEHWADSEVAK